MVPVFISAIDMQIISSQTFISLRTIAHKPTSDFTWQQRKLIFHEQLKSTGIPMLH